MILGTGGKRAALLVAAVVVAVGGRRRGKGIVADAADANPLAGNSVVCIATCVCGLIVPFFSSSDSNSLQRTSLNAYS